MTPIDWHQRAKQADLSINHCIEGELVALTEGETITKYAPRDGSLLYSLPVGTPTEMERAILAPDKPTRINAGEGSLCTSGKRSEINR